MKNQNKPQKMCGKLGRFGETVTAGNGVFILKAVQSHRKQEKLEQT